MDFEIPTKYWNYTALLFVVLGLAICLPILLDSPVMLYWVHKGYPLYVSVGFVAVTLYFLVRLLFIAIRREAGLVTWLLWLIVLGIVLVGGVTAVYNAVILTRHVDTIEVDDRLYHLNKRFNPLAPAGHDIYRCYFVYLLCEDYASFTDEEGPFSDNTLSVIEVGDLDDDTIEYLFDDDDP